jgi:hypothetical protein
VVETPVNPKARYGAVPVEQLWPESTLVCLGSGPSLAREDVDYCRGRARVIAIKNTVELAPWADVLYGCGVDACGQTWWNREGHRLAFGGLRYTLDDTAQRWASVLGLCSEREGGLTTDRSKLRSGHHSGFQAINLAVHLGARRIVLLGYDMQPSNGKDHYFGAHPYENELPYRLFLMHFPTIVEPLRELGIEVVNCSRETALTIFPRQPLREVLQ